MGKESEWELIGVRVVRGSPSERTCDGCGEVLEAGKEVIVYRKGEELKAVHSESCRKVACEEIGLPFDALPEGMLTERSREEYRRLTKSEEI